MCCMEGGGGSGGEGSKKDPFIGVEAFLAESGLSSLAEGAVVVSPSGAEDGWDGFEEENDEKGAVLSGGGGASGSEAS